MSFRLVNFFHMFNNIHDPRFGRTTNIRNFSVGWGWYFCNPGKEWLPSQFGIVEKGTVARIEGS
tara:strand:- start:1435 stop:1626 length:192 start_codon:yes stop_codon:yes gene_type:complete